MHEANTTRGDTHASVSDNNSQKLDKLLLWMEGDTANPGFSDRLRLMEAILFGKEGRRGMIQEHSIMWNLHVWALCALSTVLGAVITLAVQKIAKTL